MNQTLSVFVKDLMRDNTLLAVKWLTSSLHITDNKDISPKNPFECLRIFSFRMLILILASCFSPTGYVFQIHLEQLPSHSGGDLHGHDSGHASCSRWHPVRHWAGTLKRKHPHQSRKAQRTHPFAVLKTRTLNVLWTLPPAVPEVPVYPENRRCLELQRERAVRPLLCWKQQSLSHWGPFSQLSIVCLSCVHV